MEPSTVRGKVTWISSDEGTGPDEGLAIGLGQRKYLYAGYISEDTWRNHGMAHCMDRVGWWLVTGPDMVPMARFASPDDGREFMDMMAGILQKPPPLFAVSPDGSFHVIGEDTETTDGKPSETTRNV